MVVCMFHPKYDGKSKPVLQCKTCCDKFIAEIRASQEAFDPEKWLKEKSKGV